MFFSTICCNLVLKYDTLKGSSRRYQYVLALCANSVHKGSAISNILFFFSILSVFVNVVYILLCPDYSVNYSVNSNNYLSIYSVTAMSCRSELTCVMFEQLRSLEGRIHVGRI